MKKRRVKLTLLLVIILFISIGFAVLSTNLSINGLFNFTSNTWSIVFKNVVVDDTSVTKTAPSINQDEDTITFSAELNKPGDYYAFNVDVENNSSIDAMLGSITTTGITSQYSNYLDCIVTYSNGTTPNPNDILYKTARITFNIKLLYKDITTNQIPENVLTPTVTVTINYRQANSNAVFVSDTNHWNFDYTGSAQTFNVPKTGNYKIELWGASGGDNTRTTNYIGGRGGYVSGIINLTKDENIFTYVGSKGQDGGKSDVNLVAGYNGGGSFYRTSAQTTPGGGATDIRLTNGNWDNFDSLKSRIMVAGAGGGMAYPLSNNSLYVGSGGAGGGLTGQTSNDVGNYSSNYMGSGGTVNSTGYCTISTNTYGLGGFGYGGNGISTKITLDGGSTSDQSAGGGSGYYGGGGSCFCAPGGGGSSYISGHNGCDSISSSSTSDNIIHTGSSTHSSTRTFTNTIMIDGNGYRWTTVKGNEVVGMPNKNGIGTVTGNSGNGFAKITLMG